MIEFEHNGKRYQARARRMVKHWHVYIQEIGQEDHTLTEWPAGDLSEAQALKKGIFSFFGKPVD